LTEIGDIEATDFGDVIKNSSKPVVVEFWVRSYSYCMKFKSVYEQLLGIFDDSVTFTKMNMLKSIENLRLAEGFGVEQTPTTRVFCRGDDVGKIRGYVDFEEAVEKIREIIASSPNCGA
jgi:thioredoxin-like negative regulator of GroEL